MNRREFLLGSAAVIAVAPLATVSAKADIQPIFELARTNFRLHDNPWNGELRSLKHLNRRLSDEKLAELTM